MSLILSSPSGSATFIQPTVAFLNTAGRYFVNYNVGYGIYPVQEIAVPGVDGVAVKRLGFRGRTITIQVAYVGATAQAVNDMFNTDHDNLVNSAISVTIPDDRAYPNCEVLSITTESIPLDSGFNTFYFYSLWTFDQKRL